PPPGVDIRKAVEQAEQIPMGVKTDPEFDREVLEPRVTAYNQARRENASAQELAARAALIRQAMEPGVRRGYDETQRSIPVLAAGKLAPLPALTELERREREEFDSFMASRDAGYGLSLRDRPKLAAFKLTAREDAAQNFEAAVLCGDRVGRARGVLAGHVVR